MNEAVVFAAIVLGGLFLWFATGRQKAPRYRKKSLLTGGEREFFYRLRQALPECVVCPQVAASALLEPAGIGPARQAAADYIAGRRLGYVVFDEDMSLLAVVELSHRSRRSRKDAARDAYFADAGIRTVRFSASRLPSEAKIRSRIFSRDARPRPAEPAGNAERAAVIEYARPETPWRNTVNAHS